MPDILRSCFYNIYMCIKLIADMLQCYHTLHLSVILQQQLINLIIVLMWYAPIEFPSFSL